MTCHHVMLSAIGWFVFILGISTVYSQTSECVPFYKDKPNATCWRKFPVDPINDCSHKFCYELSEGATEGCSQPWRKPTIHREREIERIATLARNQFVTQPECTMRLRTNKNTKTNLHFFQNESDCSGLETFTLSHDSCAILHLSRKLNGYCIWYHNVCPKVPVDVTVCKRDKDAEIPTHFPRLVTTGETSKKSSLSVEIIIIVAVFANLLILIVVVFIVSFLLKRSRMASRRNTLTLDPSNRPLPRVPRGEPGKNVIHRISKVDSAEFDKWKDESHYMYLSHESLDTPRYHSVTENDIRKAVESHWDYSYPDMEKLKRFSSNLEATSDTSSYMALMKDEKAKPKAKEIREHSEKSTVSEVIDNQTPCYVKSEQDATTHAQSDVDCTENHAGNQHIKSFAYLDNNDDYSELKVDYYVLEENDSKNESETVRNAGDRTIKSDEDQGQRDKESAREENSSHDYFQLENEGKETNEIPRRSPEEVDDQDSMNEEQLCTEDEHVGSGLSHSQQRTN